MEFQFLYKRYKNLCRTISSKNRLESTFARLAHLVKDKDCFVLGSSPEPSIEMYNKHMPLMCVNGSAAIAKKLGLQSPVITVVDFELLDPSINKKKPARSKIISSGLLNDIDLGVVVSAQSNSSIGGGADALGGVYSDFIEIYKSDCRSIIHQVTKVGNLENDVHGLLSRGAFTVGMCAWLGASSVTFSGFSLFKDGERDYFYENKMKKNTRIEEDLKNKLTGWDTRSHTMADCLLLGQLSVSGCKIYTDSKEFVPLLQNWGNTPPDWAKRLK